jgi:peptidase E
MSGKIYIMGPQRPTPNLPEVLEERLPDGPLCVISSGWRHDEEDLEALQADLKRDLLPIPLYRWFDSLGSKEPELAKQHADRQRMIRRFKKMYRMHLHTLLDLWTRTQDFKDESTAAFFGSEEKFACQSVQSIDRHALERLDGLRNLFPELSTPWTHPSALPYFQEIRERLDRSSGLLITGGHVAILRNRMFFFGLQKLLADFIAKGKPIFSWSAGAMALAEKIVLFYDDPPEGEGHAELLDSGLGFLPAIFLPHAAERLDLGDRERISRFSRRFAPDTCIALESGALLSYDGKSFQDLGPAKSVRKLEEGGLVPFGGLA